MKIGVYGGSFNPCNLGHKLLVEKLLNMNIFDFIIILPTGNFYKKSNLLKGEERIKMLKLMFEANEKVIISDYEFKNNLICTYRSLDYLKSVYKDAELYFILGSDNLVNFHTWKRYEYILTNYHLCIIRREQHDVTELLAKYETYKDHLLFLDLDLEIKDISSTKIRNYLFEDAFELAKPLLDSKVFDYITDNKLYQKGYVEKASTYEDLDDFLTKYDSNSYEKISITTDIALFSISDIEKEDYRKNNKKAFSILLVKRTTPPFIDKYCLPGGFLSLDETLMDCAKRILVSETNLDDIFLEQLQTFSDVDRDIRTRVVSCAYLGLVDKNTLTSNLRSNAHFFTIGLEENQDIIKITFTSEEESFTCKVRTVIDKYHNVEFEELENEYLAFDNLKMIMSAINYLKTSNDLDNLIFHMLPKYFTLKELQLVYETILGKKLIDSVFRRNIKDLVVKTEQVKNDGGHRPSNLYTYKY